MRIGISLSSSLQAETPAAVATTMVERARVAYDSDLASLSVGDHHAHRGWYMQNTATLGRLLAEWPDRAAGCLFLLPLWSPVLVAEQVGTLAAMVDAPFIVQTGIGGGKIPFEAFGADLRQRGRVTDESIRVIQALLAGETVESAMLGIGPVAIGLRPTQEIEWWIGGHANAAIRRAATVGTAWYGGPDLTPTVAEPIITRYHAACGDAGSTPRVILRRDVLVLADGDRARGEAERLVAQGYRGMTIDQLVVGDPDDARRQLEALASVGCDDVIIRNMSSDQNVALETIQLFGQLGPIG